MKTIETEVKKCNMCKHNTVHQRNATKTNWGLHIVGVLLTGGLWMFVLIPKIIFRKDNGNEWVCSKCGTEKI